MTVAVYDAMVDISAEHLLARKQPSATRATSSRAGANAKRRKIASDDDDSDDDSVDDSDDDSDYSKPGTKKRARRSQSKAPAAKKPRT